MDPVFHLFHDIDLDGTGFINREEMQRVFNVLGCFEVSESAVDEMILLYDANHDGVISFSEYTKMAAGLPVVTELLLVRSREYWSLREKRERRWERSVLKSSTGPQHHRHAGVALRGEEDRKVSDATDSVALHVPAERKDESAVPLAGQPLSSVHIASISAYLHRRAEVLRGYSLNMLSDGHSPSFFHAASLPVQSQATAAPPAVLGQGSSRNKPTTRGTPDRQKQQQLEWWET